MVTEFEVLFRLGWRWEVFIVDDNFIENKSHARSILGKLIEWNKRRGKPFSFWCQASVNLGRDLALIDLMTEANSYQVVVGVESPDEEVLGITRKYQNVRNPLMESINTMKRNGLGIEMRPTRRYTAFKRGDANPPPERAHKDPLKRKLLACWALTYLVWWIGIVTPSRAQFWKQPSRVRKENLSRFVKYMLTVPFGHALHRYIRQMLQDIASF